MVKIDEVDKEVSVREIVGKLSSSEGQGWKIISTVKNARLRRAYSS